jgi:hypothetical protein
VTAGALALAVAVVADLHRLQRRFELAIDRALAAA